MATDAQSTAVFGTSTNDEGDASNMAATTKLQSGCENLDKASNSDSESEVQNEDAIEETDHGRISANNSTSKMNAPTESASGTIAKKNCDTAARKIGRERHADSKTVPPTKKRKGVGSALLEEDSEQEEEPTNEIQASNVFNGMIEFPLEPLKCQLICFSCKGYFREPYTIAECLHTFCKSCLFLKFHSGVRRCPRCDTSLDPDPYKAVLADRTLQELLDKIFPELKEMDEKKELEFYKKRGIELKESIIGPKDSEANSSTCGAGESNQSQVTQSNDKATASKKSYHDGYQQSLTSRGTGHEKYISIPVDEMNFKLIPDKTVEKEMNSLQNELIRTSGQLKVGQIKKYLIKKLELSESSPNLDVLCNGDPLGDELSLTFIQRTRWLHPSKDLCLHYCFEEEGAY